VTLIWLALLQAAASPDIDACKNAVTAGGARQLAIETCDRAAAVDPTPQSIILLAAALLQPDGQHPTPKDIRLAKEVAAKAVAKFPNAVPPYRIQCEIALEEHDNAALRDCSPALTRLDYFSARTQFYAGIVAVHEKRWDEAEHDLERARQFGLDARSAGMLAQEIDVQRPAGEDVFNGALWVLGCWLGGFAALMICGAILSRLTLRAARRVPTERSGHARGFDAIVRKLYRVLLWMCCAYYYLSIPFIVIVVLAAGGGAIYLALQMTYVSLWLLLVIVVAVIATIAAVGRALFVVGRNEDPGLRLEREKSARFHAVLEEVANKIGTRPIDAVYLTPGTEFAVAERGGVLRQMTHVRERCLIAGVALFEGLKVRELKSILAHEYGHFPNRDTAGGGFALAVRRSVTVLALSLAGTGAALWFNPAWWFVDGFYRLFLRISQGASRLQEVLADRWAAYAYGSDAFVRGIRHSIARSIAFNAHLAATVKEVIKDKRPLANVYHYQPAKTDGPPDLEKAVEAHLTIPAGPFDSHPSPADRIAWVRALSIEAEASTDEATEVWSLFESREELETQLTAVVRQDVARTQGAVIPDSDPPVAAGESA
jgi:Zn-dependent protease with chaperone function